jgi:hypothetical protein
MILAVVAATIMTIFAYFQISEYFAERHEINQQRQAIQKSVAESTEGTVELLSSEIKTSSITYGEIIDKGTDLVKKISEVTIPVGISSLPGDEKTALKQYLFGLQELLRLQVAANRKEISVNVALESYKRANEDLSTEFGYGREYALKRSIQASDEADRALKEYKTAANDFAKNVSTFKAQLATIRKQLSSYSLINESFIADVEKKLKTRLE